jgi:uncharacterized protein YbjT (DUF2867 family)
MRIFLVGATGFIGRHLAAGLEAAGYEVAGGGRTSGDLARDSVERWTERLAGFELVVNAAGLIQPRRGATFEAVHAEGPRRLFTACLAAGVRRFLHVSALGADEGGITRFHRSKFAAERSFRALDAHGRRLDWCVLRPSLVIGRGGGSTALFSALAALPRPVRLGPGTWEAQPIPAEELVAAVLRLVTSPEPLPRVLDLVGPAPLSTDRLTQILRDWLGLPPRPFIAVPEGVLRLAALAGTLFGGGAVAGESLTMLRRGNVGDPKPLEQLLGRPPLGTEAALARDPASQADRWHARLYFLRLPLRLALALLWIATGIASLGLYPVADSLALLQRVGLTGPLAWAALHGAAFADLALGLLLLLRWRPVLVGALQIALMTGFTMIISVALPEWWLHPFGPITKNIPVALATLVMMALEAEP